MSFGNRTAQALLNSLFGKTSNFGALATAPAIYVAVSSTTWAEDGTGGTEPSAGAYARQLVNAAGWNAATLADPSLVDNNGAITFPQATADWLSAANLIEAGLFDAVTVGNFLAKGILTVAKPVLDGDTLEIPDGDLDITLD